MTWAAIGLGGHGLGVGEGELGGAEVLHQTGAFCRSPESG
jgi:hypothetical protein